MHDDALLAEARDVLPDVIALRRRIHANPELGLENPETQRAVLGALEGLPLEIETSRATTGVVATLEGERDGPTLLLRADTDALPLREETGLPFASEREGTMHACGHDAHTAMLVGAARILSRHRDAVAGTVKLLFQPGEEGYGGARVLIEEGLLERAPRVDAAFAIHVDPTLSPGAVALRPGPILAAADVFGIDIAGRGGHASMPHHAVDPVPVACELVMALQSFVTRRVDAFDPVVVSVTRIDAGTTHNVIPATAHLAGTVRSVSERARRAAHDGIRRVTRGIAAAHDVKADVNILEGYPVTCNDAAFAAFTRDVAGALFGERAVVEMPAPIMGAEDFSYILDRVPGAMVFLGVSPGGDAAPIHSNRMVLEESAMASGIALHVRMALEFLARGGALGAR
ncbi:MAG: amidohydrolase [Deltaproteobacteria bacterium]|nr:MAG: amidohydrolase [Deltaproteobacteria bacterium]